MSRQGVVDALAGLALFVLAALLMADAHAYGAVNGSPAREETKYRCTVDNSLHDGPAEAGQCMLTGIPAERKTAPCTDIVNGQSVTNMVGVNWTFSRVTPAASGAYNVFFNRSWVCNGNTFGGEVNEVSVYPVVVPLPASCPTGSKSTNNTPGASCACNTGWRPSSDGKSCLPYTCEPGKSRPGSWEGPAGAGSGTMCGANANGIGACSMSGPSTNYYKGPNQGPGVYWNTGTMTQNGQPCDPPGTKTGGADGTTPPTDSAGGAAPQAPKCGAGSCPLILPGSGREICLPCASNNQESGSQSTKSSTSSNSDGTTTTTQTDKRTDCTGTTCTTTTTTTTTNRDSSGNVVGTPTVVVGSQVQDQQSFCYENPTDRMCSGAPTAPAASASVGSGASEGVCQGAQCSDGKVQIDETGMPDGTLSGDGLDGAADSRIGAMGEAIKSAVPWQWGGPSLPSGTCETFSASYGIGTLTIAPCDSPMIERFRVAYAWAFALACMFYLWRRVVANL